MRLFFAILMIAGLDAPADNDSTKWTYSFFTGTSVFSVNQYWFADYSGRVSYTENIIAPQLFGLQVRPPKSDYFLEYSGGFGYQPALYLTSLDYGLSNLKFTKSFHFVSIAKNFRVKNNLYFGYSYINTPLDYLFIMLEEHNKKSGFHLGYGRVIGNIELELRIENFVNFKTGELVPHNNIAFRIKSILNGNSDSERIDFLSSKGLSYGVGMSLFAPVYKNDLYLGGSVLPSHFHELRYFDRSFNASIDLRRKTWTQVIPNTIISPLSGHMTWNYFGISKYLELKNTYLRFNLSYFSANDVVAKWLWSVDNDNRKIALHEGVYSERGISAAVAVSLFKRMELELRFDTYFTYFEDMQKPVNPASLSLNLQYLFF